MLKRDNSASAAFLPMAVWRAGWTSFRRSAFPKKNQYVIITNKNWRRLRFETPVELETQFRKMLALQKISLNQPADQSTPSRLASPNKIVLRD